MSSHIRGFAYISVTFWNKKCKTLPGWQILILDQIRLNKWHLQNVPSSKNDTRLCSLSTIRRRKTFQAKKKLGKSPLGDAHHSYVIFTWNKCSHCEVRVLWHWGKIEDFLPGWQILIRDQVRLNKWHLQNVPSRKNDTRLCSLSTIERRKTFQAKKKLWKSPLGDAHHSYVIFTWNKCSHYEVRVLWHWGKIEDFRAHGLKGAFETRAPGCRVRIK